jgi:proteasome lid subunit RPN8/RPN11
MPDRSAPALAISTAAQAVVLRAARQAVGAEACGYLLGTRAAGSARIDAALVGENAHPRPAHAFRLSPRDQLAARREARLRGLEVVGHWHVHRLGPARPSAADRRGTDASVAPWMVIVGRRADGTWELTAWWGGAQDWVQARAISAVGAPPRPRP